VGEFGDKFRKAREKKELSFDDVSNVTKISSRMLQAIEEEHFDQLPGGVFNKGFIRAYAKHLGLNDEEAITDYLACLRQAQIDAHEVWEPARAGAPQPRAQSPERRRAVEPNLPAVKPQTPTQIEELPELHLPRAEDVRPRRKDFSDSSREIPWGIVAVAVVVIVLGIILWTRRSHHATTAAANTSPAITAPTSAQATTTPATIPQTTTSQPAPAATSTKPAASQPHQTAPSAATPGPSLAPNSQPPQSAPTPAAAHPPDAASTTPSSPETNDNNDVTVRSSAKPNPKTPEKSAPLLTLVIRATETSWISVMADGQTVSQETLIAPAHTSVRANREIVARVGNAAGVTFLWNGQDIPADGAEGEVKTFVFDSTGMRVAAPSSQPTSQNP
jgi:cytoskeleton protein RodZ